MKRWLDRIQQFTFDVCYIPGKENKGVDALRRFLSGEECVETMKKIFEFHQKNAHRKKIKNDLEKMMIKCSERDIEQALSQCVEYLKKDKQAYK